MKSFIAAAVLVSSADACFGSSSACQVHGPASAAEQPAWLEALKQNRTATQVNIGWDGGISHQVPWTLKSYIQPQVHPYDRYLWDPDTKTFTVGRYLADLEARYGGIDSVLMWPVYTQIGIDDRNQFDMWRSMPGGLEGIKNLTAQFHKHGVKFLWPEKPWDVGTRREPLSDAETYAKLLKQTDGDGLNGDTLGFFDESYYAESVKLGHPIALEAEGGASDRALKWTTMGWGYWDYPEAPVVDRFKFVTEGKFLTNVCNRWAQSKTNDTQSAWFNGDGYESWENVWGVWNGITPRDGEVIRRVATMLRHFGKSGILNSPDWEPHTREVYQDGIYASKFPSGSQGTVWTIVNRKGEDKTVNLTVQAGKYYYDCYHGTQLTAAEVADSGAHIDGPQVSFPIEADGFGCVYQTDQPLSSESDNFLMVMQKMTAKPLASFDSVWKYLPQAFVENLATAPVSEAPVGTVFVPREEHFNFNVSGVEIEGNDKDGVGTQYPWEEHPQRHHFNTMSVGPFHMDKFPVTIANYSAYLEATGYRPADSFNWLQNWKDADGGKHGEYNGSTDATGGVQSMTAPAWMADLPVTFVSFAEAKEYCSWKGARLPHSWEWQYAAQGTDGRLFPWGGDEEGPSVPFGPLCSSLGVETKRCQDLEIGAPLSAGHFFPTRQNGTIHQGAESVTAYSPVGDSPFGVSDLIGNVWQYTSEVQDDHNRYVILRGGSNYYPQGSFWYFPQATQLNHHNKYFLFSDSYERASTVGFRCVVDAPAEPKTVFV